MSVVRAVLCFLITVSAVSAIRSKKECDHYSKYIVTINEGYNPYWYQMYFYRCLQGGTIQEIPAYTFHIRDKRIDTIYEISDFPTVKEIYIENIGLEEIPEYINLPKLEKISLASNKLKRIRSKVFSQTPVKELVLSRNSISVIDKEAFGNDVEIIYMTCNNISTLSPTWFKNPQKIKTLRFGGNKIKIIPDNMFRDFVNLMNLELRNNQITTLGVGSISGPIYMQLLHLAYNNISEIKAEVFGPNINISSFNVEYNRLSFLHQGMMDKVTARSILTWGNPWQCPCLRIIDAWIAKNNKDFSQGLPRDEDPSCVTALSFKNVCVPFVDDDLYETFLMTFETSPFQFC